MSAYTQRRFTNNFLNTSHAQKKTHRQPKRTKRFLFRQYFMHSSNVFFLHDQFERLSCTCLCLCVFFCSSCNSLLFVVIVVAAAVFCFRMSICLTQLWNAHRFLQPDKFSDDIKMSLYTVFVLLPMTTFSLMQQWKLHSRTKGAKVQSSAFYEYQFFVWQFSCVNHTKKIGILSRLSRVSDLCKNVENVYCSTQSINHKTISHMHNNQLK